MTIRLSLLRRAEGFGLMELLVTIILVGILVGVAMQSVSVVVESARRVGTEREMASLSRAIVGDPSVTQNGVRSDFGFVGDNGVFPSDLTELRVNPGGWSTWRGPYVSSGLAQDSLGYVLDEWGGAYAYDGLAITSTAGGSALKQRLADTQEDYLRNTFNGVIRDANDNPPGSIQADSMAVTVTVPTGTGSLTNKIYQPNAGGFFTLDSIPAGTHLLRIVHSPTADTLRRYVTVLPRNQRSGTFVMARANFGDAVAAGGVDTVLMADFDSDDEGFAYSDDTFRGTSQPAYASGQWNAGSGFTGGGISVTIGAVNNNSILDMSGGWSADFVLTTAGEITISFRYLLEQTAEYEPDEYSEMLVSVDGNLYGVSPNDYVEQIVGDGPGGPDISTGWQQVELAAGTLSTGTHTITVGGYNNKKTTVNEETEVTIDDVIVVSEW